MVLLGSFYECYLQCYTAAVKEQIDSGKQLDEIEVDFHLLTMKPLHGRWLIALYNYMTTSKGRDIIKKGWKKAGVAGLLNGTTVTTNAVNFSPKEKVSVLTLHIYFVFSLYGVVGYFWFHFQQLV